MARLWICLAETTAGRISRMPRFGPRSERFYDGIAYLEWQPRKKRSKPVSVPRGEMLEAELQNHDLTGRGTCLVTEYGNPFASSGSLDNRIRKWLAEAGLTDETGKVTRSQPGIRKGVAEILAESGASVYEIMSVLGHSEPKTTARYTEKADRRRLATAAYRKRNDPSTGQGGPRSRERGPHSDHEANKSGYYSGKWQPVGVSPKRSKFQ